MVDKTTTSTEEEWLNNQVTVYPNPASDRVTVQLDELRAESIMVFNSLGQRVADLPARSDLIDLNTSQWENGIYLMKIQTDKGVATKRVIIQ